MNYYNEDKKLLEKVVNDKQVEKFFIKEDYGLSIVLAIEKSIELKNKEFHIILEDLKDKIKDKEFELDPKQLHWEDVMEEIEIIQKQFLGDKNEQ